MSINPADPKWLEILKASGWQTFALAAACGIIIILINHGIIPTTDDPLWLAIPSIGGIVFGLLALTSILSASVNYLEPGKNIKVWSAKRKLTKEAEAFIPYMTEADKAIIGYLLHHNQRMFQYEQDGGYAAPLISKGIIQISASSGQIFHPSWVSFEVPDYIWTVLDNNRESFSFLPKDDEAYPWAINWVVR